MITHPSADAVMHEKNLHSHLIVRTQAHDPEANFEYLIVCNKLPLRLASSRLDLQNMLKKPLVGYHLVVRPANVFRHIRLSSDLR